MFLLEQNLDKLVTSSLLISKIIKIPDVFQAYQLIAATKIVCDMSSTILKRL